MISATVVWSYFVDYKFKLTIIGLLVKTKLQKRKPGLPNDI